jgi:hypothetical protein
VCDENDNNNEDDEDDVVTNILSTPQVSGENTGRPPTVTPDASISHCNTCIGTDNVNASPQARMSCIKGPQRNTLRQFEKSTGGVLSYSLVLPTHHCE